MRYIRRDTLVTRLQLFAAALLEALDDEVFTLNDKKTTAAAIVAGWVEYEQAVAAIRRARGAWLDAIARARALEKTVVMPTLLSLQTMVRARYGLSNEELRAFGIKPRKRRKRSGKAKLISAAKAAATRKARGTTGKKRR